MSKLKKKLLTLSIVTSILLFPITTKAMTLPAHSLIIGNIAYSIDYIVQPKHYDIVNQNIKNQKNIYYFIKDNVVKDINTNQYVNESLFKDNYYLYIDKDGNVYISFDGLQDFESIK